MECECGWVNRVLEVVVFVRVRIGREREKRREIARDLGTISENVCSNMSILLSMNSMNFITATKSWWARRRQSLWFIKTPQS